MPAFEIPLIPSPQKLSISLGGNIYLLSVAWNVAAQVWVVDFDDVDGNEVLSGVPLVVGADLLEQYEYLGFGGALYAVSETNDDPPTYTSLGVTGHLLFVTP